MDLLMRYDYPGNVRELENLVERLVILAETDVIGVADLPEKVQMATPSVAGVLTALPDEGIQLKPFLEELENLFIDQALARAEGVKSKAAKFLGLNRTTLVEKLRKRGMLDDESTPAAHAPSSP